ncbi:MAG: glycosyltransferase family 4 protein, partial [Candidatus Delongbacteria bacterium]
SLYFIVFIVQIFLFKYILKIKLFWTIHNLYPHKHYHKSLEKYFSIKMIKLADGVIAHSISNKEQIINEFNATKFSDKIFVIPHGHFINNYANNISYEESRRAFNISVNDFVFLFFGRIEEYKGVLKLIDCFKKLQKEYYNIHLLIAGAVRNENLKQKIIERTDNNGSIKIEFKSIGDDEIQNYMKCSNIVVIPYENIFTSGSAILAMSFSKPIIIPRFGGVREILSDESNFYYENNRDVETGLYEQMKNAIIQKDRLVKMGSDNYEKIVAINWTYVANLTQKAYGK